MEVDISTASWRNVFCSGAIVQNPLYNVAQAKHIILVRKQVERPIEMQSYAKAVAIDSRPAGRLGISQKAVGIVLLVHSGYSRFMLPFLS